MKAKVPIIAGILAALTAGSYFALTRLPPSPRNGDSGSEMAETSGTVEAEATPTGAAAPEPPVNATSTVDTDKPALADLLALSRGELERGGTADQWPRTVLSVRVLARSAEPVAGAVVCLMQDRAAESAALPGATPGLEGKTSADGTCFLAFPSPGLFTLTARHGDHVAAVPVRAASFVEVELILSKGVGIAGRTVTITGAPVAGARVSCFRKGGGRYLLAAEDVSSDAQGAFQFQVIPPGAYTLYAEADGYAGAISGPVEPDGSPVTLLLAQGATLEATLRESSGAVAHFPVEVSLESRLRGVSAHTVTSNAQGIARFVGVPAGDFTLSSASPEFVFSPVQSPVTLSLDAVTRLDIVVQSAAAISGRVVDSATGVGIAGVILYLSQPGAGLGRSSTPTTVTGEYVFAPLASGEYVLAIRERPARYGPPQGLTQTKQLALEPGQQLSGLDFELDSGLYVEGQVRRADGTAAPGAKVIGWRELPEHSGVMEWSEFTQADSAGNFVLAQVPAEEIFLEASLRARRSLPVGPVKVQAPGVDGVVLELREEATSSISGQLVDERGMPVRGHVQCTLEGSLNDARKFSENTDLEGYFVFSEVPVGSYGFRYGPYKQGMIEYVDAAGPYAVRENQPLKDLRLVLRMGGLAISGSLVDHQGNPVPHYFVEAEIFGERGREHYATTLTDLEGHFSFENVEEGTYQLQGQPGQGVAWRKRVEGGDTVHIVLPES